MMLQIATAAYLIISTCEDSGKVFSHLNSSDSESPFSNGLTPIYIQPVFDPFIKTVSFSNSFFVNNGQDLIGF